MPAPVLPPHRFAEAIQRITGTSWSSTYLFAAVAVRSLFYLATGIMAGLAVPRAETSFRRLLQILFVPLIVVGLSLGIRAMKIGNVPVWINALVPIVCSYLGVVIGLSVLFRHLRVCIAISLTLLAIALWALLGELSPQLRAITEQHLQSVARACSDSPPGDDKFRVSLQAAFSPVSTLADLADPVQENRASILAWSIAVGHPSIARFVGFPRDSSSVDRAAALCEGTTIDNRADWAKHYALSAGLTVLEHPLVADAGGLVKEELDALTEGSGFSFGDLAADRAGVRFATLATGSTALASSTRSYLLDKYDLRDLFPPGFEFPENLTLEQFRQSYGRVGSPKYRKQVAKIDFELDKCSLLVPSPNSPSPAKRVNLDLVVIRDERGAMFRQRTAQVVPTLPDRSDGFHHFTCVGFGDKATAACFQRLPYYIQRRSLADEQHLRHGVDFFHQFGSHYSI